MNTQHIVYKMFVVLMMIFCCSDIFCLQAQTPQAPTTNRLVETKHQVPWFRNALFGFSVSTPERMTKLEGIRAPDGYEKIYNDFQVFLYRSDTSGAQLLYIDSNLESYDLEEGLKSGIGNQLNFVRATGLNLKFVKGDFQNPSLYCYGDFLINGQKCLINGMGYFNDGKIFNLVCYVFDDSSVSKEFLNKIIASVRVVE